VIPTLPLPVRNRLAETILQSLHDAEARRGLERLAGGGEAERGWLGPDERGQARLLRLRAQRASDAVRTLPLGPAGPPLDEALAAAASLFDAGLGFEVHELLEPHWVRAAGDEREALQGLIQISVGYQHLANGNATGARALLEEGARRLAGRRLGHLPLESFAQAVRESIARLPALDPAAIPRFPRRRQSRRIGRDMELGRD
jgi:predicted metal-dependent hydrolase